MCDHGSVEGTQEQQPVSEREQAGSCCPSEAAPQGVGLRDEVGLVFSPILSSQFLALVQCWVCCFIAGRRVLSLRRG